MTRAELDATVTRLRLEVPEGERDEIAAAAHYIDEMAALLRKPRSVGAEPAHTVAFPEE
jgi:hypothetical protein